MARLGPTSRGPAAEPGSHVGEPRSRARVELSIRHSLCFGAYHGGIRIMMLRTRDAHALYEKFGFGAIPQPDEMMVRYS